MKLKIEKSQQDHVEGNFLLNVFGIALDPKISRLSYFNFSSSLQIIVFTSNCRVVAYHLGCDMTDIDRARVKVEEGKVKVQLGLRSMKEIRMK